MYFILIYFLQKIASFIVMFYNCWHACMFTLQLLRKRHIGNDIVTIVFQEPGAEPFTPKTVRSHFQHVFIIVRAHNPNTDHVKYRSVDIDSDA